MYLWLVLTCLRSDPELSSAPRGHSPAYHSVLQHLAYSRFLYASIVYRPVGWFARLECPPDLRLPCCSGSPAVAGLCTRPRAAAASRKLPPTTSSPRCLSPPVRRGDPSPHRWSHTASDQDPEVWQASLREPWLVKAARCTSEDEGRGTVVVLQLLALSLPSTRAPSAPAACPTAAICS